ncbi:MAG: hypothetical protein PQJ46_06035, partial [Spirochaetales bacterium]|nr:hypothetical protein [Spirochaetales bacterium]
MKIKKLFYLFFTGLILFISLSCNDSQTENLKEITVDLSSIISKDSDSTEYWAQVKLAAESANNFYSLGDDSFQKVVDGQITISEIPTGVAFEAYITLGTYTDSIFSAKKAVNGAINASSGSDSTFTLIAKDIQLESIINGQEASGVTAIDSNVYTVINSNLYKDTESLGSNSSYTINSVNRGYSNDLILSCKNNDGYGIAQSDGTN